LQVYNAWAQTAGFGEQTLLRARLFKSDREAADHQIVGVEIVDQSEVQDFCPKYAEVKARLRIAEDQVKSLGAEMSPTQYGTAVHFALSQQIKALDDDNFIAGKSFIKSKEVAYGTSESIRIDVLENAGDGTVCVYDIKTGKAVLNPGRMNEIVRNIRMKFPQSTNFIVTEVKTGDP
jgi:hypothetical protein